MEKVRELYMHIYGDTLKKIILDLDNQLDDSEDNQTSRKEIIFLKESILIALDIYKNYYVSTEEITNLIRKYGI